jgi:hypothetical protein
VRRRFDPGRYGVAPVSDGQAKEFVTSLHYSRSYLAAVHRYGLFDLAGPAPALAGVAVLSVPAGKAVLTSVFPRLEPTARAWSWAGSCSPTRCRPTAILGFKGLRGG